MNKVISKSLKCLSFCICLIIFFLSIAIFRTLLLPIAKNPVPCQSQDKDYVSENRGLSKRLSMALQFQTVSFHEHNYNTTELLKLGSFIKKSFPLIHSSSLVTFETVNNYSLLYHVKGSDAKLKPYLLAGHLDVVPVEAEHWKYPPFEGIVDDGYIIGRGSIDCKHVVMGALEALEFLLEKGHKPVRSFYLAFGHDEEVYGSDGAAHIAKLLKSRNIRLEYVLDEGSFVLDNFLPRVHSPVAFVSVTEKGSLNLELSVQTVSGHSSLPSRETTIVILSKALSKLEGDVFPSMFGRGPENIMFNELSHCVPFPMKVVFTNLWLFKPLVIAFMSHPIHSAMHRTTTAVTIVNGGNKLNVLPSFASATVNMRVHPAQTIDEAVNFIKDVINDDRVKIKILHSMPAHPISSMDTFGFQTIKKSIQQIYNDSCVVPLTLIANTDSRWYLDLSSAVYRFSLVRITVKDISRAHGHNEKIAINNYVEVVNFFLHLMKNSDDNFIIPQHSHEDL